MVAASDLLRELLVGGTISKLALLSLDIMGYTLQISGGEERGEMWAHTGVEGRKDGGGTLSTDAGWLRALGKIKPGQRARCLILGRLHNA